MNIVFDIGNVLVRWDARAAFAALDVAAADAFLSRVGFAGLNLRGDSGETFETWPVGLATHPRLATAFATTIVSGQEGVPKPDPAIFAALCDRAGITPSTCVFIDDSERNAAGARDFGMDAIHFTTPEALETALTERGLL